MAWSGMIATTVVCNLYPCERPEVFVSAYILCITTGGTIAMKRGPGVGGAVPSLKGDDFQALLPRSGQQVVFEEATNIPSSHLTPASVTELLRRIETRLQLPEVTGIVVTYGTDTLEETAYLLDLVLNSPKPVVVTGAMRTASAQGYDGIANLAQAILVAASPEARELGTLVVFSGQLFAAADVQKINPQSLDAFAAPASGPIGRVENGQVLLHHRPMRTAPLAFTRLEERVDLLTVAQGSDDRLLRAVIDSGSRGLVLETLGSGRVPPWWLPTLQELRARGVPVVITTRCLTGSIGDEYGYVGAFHDLRRLGCLFAHNLPGPKARIKLMAALGTVKSPDELRQFFS